MKKNIIIIPTIVVLLLFSYTITPISSLSINSKNLDLIGSDTFAKPTNLFDLDMPRFESNKLIVKFKSDINVKGSTSTGSISPSSISSFDSLGLSNVYKITLSEDSDVLSAMSELQESPDVEYVQLDYTMKTCVEPNDPYYSSSGSWGQSFQDLYGMHLINMRDAWDISTGSDEIVVAIIDTGVDYNHEDLGGNMWINSDEIPDNDVDDDSDGFVDNIYGANLANNTGDPMDDNGHGTHCAGIIGAVGNNAKGVVGVNWQTKIMAVKAIKADGEAPSSVLAEGIIWAADNGADIISNSWGPDFRLPKNPVVEDAVEYAYNQGCIVVFAAGNENDDVEYYSPANMEETIAVAASTNNDGKAYFSNWGEKIDVCAPGYEILSLRANNTDMYALKGRTPGSHFVPPYDSNAKYYRASGTSMACPHVAGLAALLLANNSGLSLDMIKTIIRNAVDEIDSEEKIGLGRINAYEALASEPVISVIDAFPNYGEVAGVISITGSAWAENFQNYSVHYGRGKNPGSWTNIIISTSIVQNNVLATLDTTALEDGYHTVRLTVTCSDIKYYHHVGIVVNNLNDYLVVDKGAGANYSYIMEAVDDAGSGDEIFVNTGTYYEGLVIQRTIKLTGESKKNTIIHSGKRDGIYVLAEQVNISNFKIETSGTSDLMSFGIYMESDHNEISDIKMPSGGPDDPGIVLFYASHNSITNCNIKYKSFGMYLSESLDNIIINCTFYENDIAIRLKTSSNNLVFHNNFIASDEGHAFDDGNNDWDNGNEGNYWDDYAGEDENEDEIGDTPYEILDGNNEDRYPLMKAYGVQSDPPNTPDTPSGPTSGAINVPYQYSTKATDPDGDDIKYGWDWDDDNVVDEWTDYSPSSATINTYHTWQTNGIYLIKVKARDLYGEQSDFSETFTVDISSDNEPPVIQITKPQRALYIFNIKIRTYLLPRNPLIIGKINIEANVSDEDSGVDSVEFYVDGELKANFTSEPYSYQWAERTLLTHKHTIKVIAFDNVGNQDNETITVRKYL